MSQFNENPFQNMQIDGSAPPSPPSFSRSVSAGSSTEELIEAIIEEKWEDLIKDLSKLAEWKNAMTSKVETLEKRFEDLRGEFNKVHNAIISKVDDYDKNMSNVGAEVKAMEKVFSKVLPLFTENVAELSKVTRELKNMSIPSKK